jgi:hypothetical protein
MRTTIDLPDDLLAKAKRLAVESNRPLRAIIEDALRGALARRQTHSRAKPIALTTFGGTGLQPGVDLDDTSSLLELMETPGDSPRR